MRQIERTKETAHIGPGAHTPHKEFGSDLNKVHFGGKYKWKPDSNPPPGLYEIEKAMNKIKPNISSTRLLQQDRSKRSDFTKQNQRENPGSQYNHIKPFGADSKKMTIGGKYKWKADTNPPPGLYDPNIDATRCGTKSVLLTTA